MEIVANLPKINAFVINRRIIVINTMFALENSINLQIESVFLSFLINYFYL